MFLQNDHVLQSDLLLGPRICHGFSTREGGVSREEHTRTMNLSFGLGDPDEVVRENMKLLCTYVGASYDGLIGSAQYHTATVRYVTSENAHEGIERENTSPSDGFVTDKKGVFVIVRSADCTPILFAGEKEDGSPVVAAVHAGWRGTVNGIADAAVSEMKKLGAVPDTIKAAIGPCIHECHFEVKEDFVSAVEEIRGARFAARYIGSRDGKLYADMVGMNVGILRDAGVKMTDVCPFCTVCDPDRFHSHRATGGKRGTMGAVIGIV